MNVGLVVPVTEPPQAILPTPPAPPLYVAPTPPVPPVAVIIFVPTDDVVLDKRIDPPEPPPPPAPH